MYIINLIFFSFLIAPCTAFASTVDGRGSVIDGDTLEIHGLRVRLNGIDAFESKQLCNIGSKIYKCGNKSAWYLDGLISDRPIKCIGTGKDRYGRLLAECYVGNVSLNQNMVSAGWALAFRKYSSKYIKTELAAKRSKAGAWAGEFTTPWDYRSNIKTPYNPPATSSTFFGINSSPNKFKSCKEANRAGVYRILKGDPMYNPRLDGDKDGIACE